MKREQLEAGLASLCFPPAAPLAAEMCGIPVDVRAKWRWQLYADLSSVSGHPGNPGSCVGIFHRKSSSNKSPFHVP